MGDRFGIHTQDEPFLVVGNPDFDPIESMEVEWPSGLVHVVEGPFPPGPVTVQEPDAITVKPASLSLKAGSGDIVTIEATARHPSGEIDTQAEVVIDTPWQPATWLDEGIAIQPGVFQRRLVAPNKPGRIRIEVRVNGKPWRIRPWFTFRL